MMRLNRLSFIIISIIYLFLHSSVNKVEGFSFIRSGNSGRSTGCSSNSNDRVRARLENNNKRGNELHMSTKAAVSPAVVLIRKGKAKEVQQLRDEMAKENGQHAVSQFLSNGIRPGD